MDINELISKVSGVSKVHTTEIMVDPTGHFIDFIELVEVCDCDVVFNGVKHPIERATHLEVQGKNYIENIRNVRKIAIIRTKKE